MFFGDAFGGEVEENSAGAGGTEVPVVIPAGMLDRVGVGMAFDAELLAVVFLFDHGGDLVQGLLGGGLEGGFSGGEEEVALNLDHILAPLGFAAGEVFVSRSGGGGGSNIGGSHAGGADGVGGGGGIGGGCSAGFGISAGLSFGFELSIELGVLLVEAVAFVGGFAEHSRCRRRGRGRRR